MKGAVAYTDGSARPTNPGHVGWGVHGYLYTESPENKPYTYDNNYATAYSYVPIADKKKVKQFVKPTEFFDCLGGLELLGSQNVGELTAIIKILEKLLEYELDAVQILTDAEYVRNGFCDWMISWQKQQWKKRDGAPVANIPLWERLIELKHAYQERGIKLSVDHVRAHEGELGNTIADCLAGTGAHFAMAGRPMEQMDFVPAKKYLEGEVERHPFINHPRIYFNSIPGLNTRGTYFQCLSGGPDSIMGKRISESAFSIIHINEADETLELLKQRQFELSQGANKVFMIPLENAFNKRVDRFLKRYGVMATQQHRSNQNLLFVDKSNLTAEASPVYLSLRGMEYLSMLYDLLKRFRDDAEQFSAGKSSFHAHDITNWLYEKQVKTVKGVEMESHILRKEFCVGYKECVIDAVEEINGKECKIPIPLVFNLDILPRNPLKRIEKLHPSVHLITWRETSMSLQYATVIECDDGYGIWSNLHASRILLQHFSSSS